MDQKKSKQNKKEDQYKQAIIQNGYEIQNQELISKGYTNLKKNLKLLTKYNGDINHVLEKLNKSNKKKQDLLQKIKEKGMEENHKYLTEQGFKNPQQVYKALKSSNNQKEKALQILQQYEKTSQIKNEIKVTEYEQQVQSLKEMGYKIDMDILNALKQADGNIDQTIAFLGDKGNVQLNQQIMQLKKQLKSKLKYLNDQGFGNKSKNLKLLALCNGDIDKVLEILRMKINNETK